MVADGLLFPVLVLLVTSRGSTLAELGIAVSMQRLVVALLELPTGGLADAVGRRPVLVAGTIVDAVALLVVALWADTLALQAVVWALEGLYRALEPGPLDAWYVDPVLAEDEHAGIETGLSRAAAVLSASLSSGSVIASALGGSLHRRRGRALGPATARRSLVARGRGRSAVSLDAEARPAIGRAVLRGSVRVVPAVVREALALARRLRRESRRLQHELRVGTALVRQVAGA